MSKEREALKLALDALDVANSCVDGYYIPKGKTQLPEVEQAITAIKEALAEPPLTENGIYQLGYHNGYGFGEAYAKKQMAQRKPLTENEIKHLWWEACQTNLELTSQLIVHLARNIEAAHGIKGEQ